jgi:hypothetical protein
MHAEGNICGSLAGKQLQQCVRARWSMGAICDTGQQSRQCALYWWTFYPDKVKPWMQKWIPHGEVCTRGRELVAGGAGVVTAFAGFVTANPWLLSVGAASASYGFGCLVAGK